MRRRIFFIILCMLISLSLSLAGKGTAPELGAALSSDKLPDTVVQALERSGVLVTPLKSLPLSPAEPMHQIMTAGLNDDQITEMDQRAQALFNKTGLQVLYRTESSGSWPGISYRFSQDYEQLAQAMDIVEYELLKYPQGYLTRVGVRELCLYTSVVSGGRIAAAGASNGT
ncbi:MAG TPA: hypothetical protein PLZ84_00645, partial [Clostridia bacterium]|nr:hypothetical protein [Clostridia bacterium]